MLFRKLLPYIITLIAGIGIGYIAKDLSPKNEVNKEVQIINQDKEASIEKTDYSKKTDYSNKAETKSGIPAKALETLNHINQYGNAPEGYVGGRKFKNLEGLLPKKSTSGKNINYKEWDVNPKTQGQNRGRERLVTGDDDSAYYTNDHYQSFTKIE